MAKRTVNITAECCEFLISAASNPHNVRPQCSLRSDGSFDIELDVETVARLEAEMIPGESFSDTTIRILIASGFSKTRIQ